MISVLYVDDERALLELCKLFLEKNGRFSVDIVLSASEGLDLIRTRHFDAIISDYQMPGMDGIAFLKQVRSSGNTIPFIVFTGRGREEIVIQALNEGADFYIQKGGEPVSQFAELAHKIEKAVLQRRAEASIRDHERRETDIINFLPDATFAIDTSGVVIAWNRAMEAMTGVTAAEVLGKGNYEYALPFYHERRPILIDLVLNDSKESEARYPYVTRKGDTLFSEITIPHMNNGLGAALWFIASPLYNNQGTIVGAIESIRDVSEWKKAERALNESEQRFRQLSDLLPQVVYETDATGTITYANRIAFDLFGYTREEFNRGLTVLEMIAPEDRVRATETLSRIFRGEVQAPQGDEYLALRKDGTTFSVSVFTSPVIVNDRVTGLRGIIVDMTERKKTEDLLRQSEIRFRSLIQNSSDMIRILDSEARIVYESPSTVAILGYPEGTNLGKDPLSLVHPDDLDRVRVALGEVFARENAGTPTEFRVRKADGTFIWVETVAKNMLDVPAVNGIVVTTRPIDLRKRMEETLRQNEEKYRTIFETTGTATVVIEADATISLANSEFERLSGFSREEIENRKKWTEFVVEEDLKPMLAQHRLRRTDPGQALTHYEFRFRSGSGAIRNIYLTIDLIPGTGKSVASLLDITERKRMVEELVAANREYVGLLNQIQDVYYKSDAEGRLIKASRSFAVLLGYGDVAECLGRSIAEDFYLKPEDRQRFLDEVYRAGKVTDYEVTLRRRDGTPVLVSTSSHLYYDAAGRILGVEGTFRDITEKKKTEEALHLSEQRYRNVVEDQTEFISRFLPDGTHVFVNEAYCRYFGMNRDDLLGHRFRPKIPAEDRERVAAFFASLTPANPVGTVEHRIVMPDGSVRWQRWSDRAIFDDAGRLVEYQSVGRDITDEIEAEQALKRAKEEAETIIRTANAMVVGLDNAGNIVIFNKAAEEITGYKKAELDGRNWFETLVPRDRYPRVWEEYKRRLAGGLSGQFENPIRTKSGDERHIVWSTTEIRSGQGDVTGTLSFGIDITERKRAEKALRESEEKFSKIFLNAPFPILLTRLTDGEIAEVNAEFEKLSGFSRDELVGKTTTGLGLWVHEADRDAVVNELKGGGKVFRRELLFKVRDGSIITALFSADLIRVGNQLLILSSISDITQQRRAEEALSESERKYRLLFEQSNDAIFIADLTTRTLIDCNERAEILTGYSRKELLSMPIENLHPAEVRETAMEHFSGFALGMDRSVESVVLTKDRRRVPVSINGSRVEIENLPALVGIFRDITERKQAEEALKVAQEKFTKAFLSVPDAITISELDSGVFVEVNDAAVTLFGYSREELIGKSSGELGIWVNGEDRQAVAEGVAAGGKVVDFESVQRRKSGGTFLAQINADTLVIGGRTHLISIIRDITERKRTERTIADTSRKISLLSNITRHDVANQVTALKGFVQIALAKKPEPIVSDLLAKIDTAGSAIARQIEFMKTYEELGLHDPAWFRISDIIARQRPEGIALTCSCDAEIFADPMIGKVFSNLIENAVRHGERVTEITIGCERDAEGLMIMVTDDGIGIPINEKEKIFQKGFGKNTGFGLFLAREILAITGITIHETGLHGKGARFEIHVPVEYCRPGNS